MEAVLTLLRNVADLARQCFPRAIAALLPNIEEKQVLRLAVFADFRPNTLCERKGTIDFHSNIADFYRGRALLRIGGTCQ